MKGTYNLIKAITTSQQVRVAKTSENQNRSKIVYGVMRLEPGEVYELEDDPIFLDSLEKLRVSKRYSESLEKELTAAGVDFKVDQCRSCGGRVKKLIYNIVEVHLDDDDTGSD
nr:hypothetical protein [Enterococcus innesii]